MGSTANYPYQCVMNSPFNFETWIFGVNPDTLFPYMSHTYKVTDKIAFPEICYVPDARSSQLLYSSQNVNIGTSDIKYEITREPAENDEGLSDIIFTFYRMVSDEKVVLETCSLELYKLQTDAKSKNISGKCLNLYVNVNPDKAITNVGIAIWVTFTGKNETEFYDYVLSTPITNVAVKNAITSQADVREIPGYYGTYADVLEESDGFELSLFPDEFYSKYVYSAEHNKFNEVVCRVTEDEPSAVYDLSCAWRSRTASSDYWKDLNAHILMIKCATYINANGHLGSDLFRQTSSGGYTNGADLDQSQIVITLNQERTINFSGGKIKLYCQGTGFQAPRYITIYDANGNAIDSCMVDGNSAHPLGNTYIYYDGICCCYLAQHNGHFHLFGLRKFFTLYDNDGNQIEYPHGAYNPYNMGCFFQKIYTFNEQANTILESATKVAFVDDPTYQPEDSESASLPDNMSDVYDRDSTWETGDEAGENKGVRYTGDSNVNPTDLQKTVAENIPGGHQPVEDPATQGHIPTPINTGMVNILAPTETQMSSFASDIRSDTFLQAITNYFSNPMDVVISAHTCIAPTLNNGSDKYLQYGLWTSDYTMKALKQQYYKVSMGELNIMEYTASFADYPPYSNYVMYLPYIGFRQIDGNHIVGRNLKLYYYIDVATGEILAELLYKDMASGKGCPIGYYSGNTLARFPLKSVDYSSIISNAISGVFSTASAIGQFATGNVAGGVMSMVGSASKIMSGGLSPDVNINGTVSGSMTYSMYDTPFLIRTAPHLYNMLPFGYKHFKGMPSNTGTELGNVLKMQSEYIQFDNIDLDGIVNQAGDGATQIEKEEILRLLQQGVYTK